MKEIKIYEVINSMLVEIERLLKGDLNNDWFLEKTKTMLLAINNESGQSRERAIDEARYLSRAAVRNYAAFDFTPEAERFLQLAEQLSAFFNEE